MKKAMFLIILFCGMSLGVAAAIIENITVLEKGTIVVSGTVATSNASIQLVKPNRSNDLSSSTIDNVKSAISFIDIIDGVSPNGKFAKEIRYDPSEEGFYSIRINDGISNEPTVMSFYNGDLFVGNLIYSDFNNNPLSSLTLGQPAVISANIINFSSDLKNFDVFVSMYDENNRLLNVSKENYKVLVGENRDLSYYINIPADIAVKTVKAMIWDSVDGMIPYVASAKIAHESRHEIYVSTDGDNNATGSFDQPFLTINRALQSATQYRNSTGDATGNITIYLRGGEYFITNAISIGAAHHNITIAGYPNEDVVISGGQRLDPSGFSVVTDNNVLNRIPAAARPFVVQYDLGAQGIVGVGQIPKITSGKGGSAFALLSIDGSMQNIARWPNTGYDKIQSVINTGSSSDYETLEGNMVFGYSGTRPSNWTNANNAWLVGYWGNGWAIDSVMLNSVNTSQKRITTNGVSTYNLTATSPGGRYYIFNLIEELDSPGEWYIDNDTNILYLYPNGSVQELDIQLSHIPLSAAFSIANTSGVTLQNLTVENIRGWGVRIQNSENSTVSNTIIRNIAHGGVWVQGGFGCGIYSSKIYNAGARGLRLDGGDRDTLTACGHYAINNEIHDYGKIVSTYTAGVGMYGVGMQAKHNKIYNAPHLAIQFTHNDNIIEYNEIFNVLTETADAGAIYTGRDLLGYGNIIRYNYLYDIVGIGPDSGNNFIMGVYLDDMWSGTTIYGNIFNNVEVGLMLGGGRNNTFENNIIMNSTSMQRSSMRLDSRGLEAWFAPLLPVLEQRLLEVDYQNEYWQAKYPQAYNTATDAIWYPKYNSVKNNVIYNHNQINGNSHVSQYGTVENNIMFSTDIGFVDEAGGNFMLNQNSVVYTSIPEFKPIPFDRIGLLGKNR